LDELVRREAVLPAQPAEVWRALTDPAALADWFGAETLIDARPRGRAVERRADGTTREGTVISVLPNARLVIAWDETETLPRTRLEVVLEPDSEGTRITIVETPAHDIAFRMEVNR
jgi:uncharacterized protein YndB with AHSA1/START domain